MQARGVIVTEPGGTPLLEDMVVDDPGPGEVLVRIEASGVCHTDHMYLEGSIGDDFPYLLGHEGAGIVEKVGPNVETPSVGDYVILAWRAPCGICRFCAIGKGHICADSLNAEPRMRTADGKVLTPALGLGTFCTHTVVAAKQAIPVSREIPATAACLIGCGVMTGVGAALYAARVHPGSSVAVFGCGGVGVSVIQGARLAHARTIIGVDVADNKLEWAKGFGATHVVDARQCDPVKAIKDLTGGNGTNYSFESAGRTDTLNQAIWCRDLAGTCVMIGVHGPDPRIELPVADFFGLGGALRVSWYGDCLPSRDFPLLCDLYLKKQLQLDEVVTRTIDIGDVAAAFEAMHHGEVLRSVITL